MLKNDYKTFYRKFRPQNFVEIVGQDHIKKALKNAVQTNRVAHAYLFVGQRGTGKTTTAKVLAKALNCLSPIDSEPCNLCEICVAVNEGTLSDVLEIDAASNRGIDDVRELRENVKYVPMQAKRKVYIIDEAHMMTGEAFNALLKTLEEPPNHVCFILATTEVQKIPATIFSRCQKYEFQSLKNAKIVSYLQELCQKGQIKTEIRALKMIAEQSLGSMRDALSMLEQAAIAGKNDITVAIVQDILGFIGVEPIRELVDCLIKKDLKEVLSFILNISEKGWDEKQILQELLRYFRDLMILSIIGKETEKENFCDEFAELQLRLELIKKEEILQIVKMIQEAGIKMRTVVNTKVMMEVLLMEICLLDLQFSGEEKTALLAQEISILRERLDCYSLKKPEKTAQKNVEKEDIVQNKSLNSRVLHKEQNEKSIDNENNQIEHLEVKNVLLETANKINFDLQDIWQKVLKELLQKKRLVHACLEGGILKKIENNKAFIVLQNDFAKQRLEKADFSKILKEIFSDIIGVKIDLKFVLQSDWQSWESNNNLIINKDNKKGELPLSVQKAQALFGGTVEKIENNKEM